MHRKACPPSMNAMKTTSPKTAKKIPATKGLAKRRITFQTKENRQTAASCFAQATVIPRLASVLRGIWAGGHAASSGLSNTGLSSHRYTTWCGSRACVAVSMFFAFSGEMPPPFNHLCTVTCETPHALAKSICESNKSYARSMGLEILFMPPIITIVIRSSITIVIRGAITGVIK